MIMIQCLRNVHNRILSQFYKRRIMRVISRNETCRNFSLDAVKGDYPIGRKLHGFTVVKVQDVPELSLTGVKLTHDKTGADYLHLARDDSNNVFCVGFRTLPTDNTGVPHILEHTTLCGSKKYPCRDPFFKMFNRSLATFMNAFTASDYTMYPFSTQNAKDFENLLKVYLDSVFFPQLRELDFLQEGWRLEHETVGDPKSPIVFKGVVFNEMKGAFADSERVFVQHLENSIFPTNTYSHVSGGDPIAIPQLTWSQLKQFHSAHYHPSNSRFFTYGNFPLENHLKVINEEALGSFSALKSCATVADEPRWKEPRKLQIYCQPDALSAHPDKQTTVSISYLMGSITDTFECLTLTILAELLTGGPNSPFYTSLIESNLGSDFSPMTGLETQTKQSVFSVGLKGVSKQDTNKVVSLIQKTIDDVIRTGFPSERIDAILHNIELSIKHQISNFGLALLMGLTASWNHNGDPVENLCINKQIEQFRQMLNNDPQFLQKKVKQYLKDNRHQLFLTMCPKDNYEQERQEKEIRLLEAKVSKFSDDDKELILKQGLILQENQNNEVDASSLPSLKLLDIDPIFPLVHIEHRQIAGVSLQICPQPTNGLNYFRAVLNTKELPDQDKALVPLFCKLLTKMGTVKMDYKKLAQRIELKTGGLSASPLLLRDPSNSNLYEEGIALLSYCLSKNHEDMMALWSDVLANVDFGNVDRLRTLLNEVAADLAASISDNGHRYAINRAGSCLSELGQIIELQSGVSQIHLMKRLAESDDLHQLALRLKSIAKTCLTKRRIRLSLNATLGDENSDKSVAVLERFVNSLSGSPANDSCSTKSEGFMQTSSQQHIVFPFPVSFVSRCVPSVCVTHEDYPKEKGGAYGGGVTIKPGLVAFYSYRDPKSFETLEIYEKSIEWLLNTKFPREYLDEAKLLVFSEIDKPVAPGYKGQDFFLERLSHEIKQTYRERLFKVNETDLKSVCDRYLKNAKHIGEVIIGPERQQSAKKSWKVIRDGDL